METQNQQTKREETVYVDDRQSSIPWIIGGVLVGGYLLYRSGLLGNLFSSGGGQEQDVEREEDVELTTDDLHSPNYELINQAVGAYAQGSVESEIVALSLAQTVLNAECMRAASLVLPANTWAGSVGCAMYDESRACPSPEYLVNYYMSHDDWKYFTGGFQPLAVGAIQDGLVGGFLSPISDPLPGWDHDPDWWGDSGKVRPRPSKIQVERFLCNLTAAHSQQLSEAALSDLSYHVGLIADGLRGSYASLGMPSDVENSWSLIGIGGRTWLKTHWPLFIESCAQGPLLSVRREAYQTEALARMGHADCLIYRGDPHQCDELKLEMQRVCSQSDWQSAVEQLLTAADPVNQ